MKIHWKCLSGACAKVLVGLVGACLFMGGLWLVLEAIPREYLFHPVPDWVATIIIAVIVVVICGALIYGFYHDCVEDKKKKDQQ